MPILRVKKPLALTSNADLIGEIAEAGRELTNRETLTLAEVEVLIQCSDAMRAMTAMHAIKTLTDVAESFDAP